MADERHKRADDPDTTDASEKGDGERPTVSPPFDADEFVRNVFGAATKPPQSITTPVRGTSQQARDLSRRSTPDTSDMPPPYRSGAPDAPGAAAPPSPAARGDAPRKRTPATPISLANARVPSNLPPRAGTAPEAPATGNADELRKLESLSGMNAVDREWADLEVATRPPPPGENPEQVVFEPSRQPKLDLDEVEMTAEDAIDEGSERGPSAPPLLPLVDATGATPSTPPLTPPLPAPSPSSPAVTPEEEQEREMHDRVSLGDYSGALEIAELILARDPSDKGARTCADNCRVVLRQMYATRIGPLDRVPLVMVPRDQLRWLSIDHRSGFVLSLVDGVSTIEMIIDVSGMPELDTLRILSELAQQRIISLRGA